MSSTSTGASASALAAQRPPKPPPMMTTRGRAVADSPYIRAGADQRGHLMTLPTTTADTRRSAPIGLSSSRAHGRHFFRRPTRRSIASRSWGHSTVHTACPLDCPDCCSLAVTVERGKVIKIDGSTPRRRPMATSAARSGDSTGASTAISGCCIRRPQGPEGRRRLRARDLGRGARSGRREDARAPPSASAPSRSCPITTAARTACSPTTSRTRGSSGGSARRGSRARSARRRPARRRRRCTARWPASPTTTTRTRKLIVVWGCNPSASGIHLVSHIKKAQKNGAQAGRHRSAPDAARAAGRSAPAVRPGTDLPVALAMPVSSSSAAGPTRVPRARRRRRRSPPRRRRVDDRARGGGSRHRPRRARDVRRVVRHDVAGGHPLRLGPGAQPQRRRRDDGDPGAAGGRRKVRRPRRRLHDEQLRRVGHHGREAD